MVVDVDVDVIVDGDGDGDVIRDGDGDVIIDGDGHGETTARGDPRNLTLVPPIPADMLSFQKLDVYRCAIEFVAITTEIGPAIPRGHAALRGQLRRAALSVPLNIAEGAGRGSDADAARHFAIARGSAMECAAVLDVLWTLGALQEQHHRRSLELLARVVAMLTKMCR